ncbi:MAG: hypothetical protein KY467_15860 [Gemmatimonadetes bacterium]|nr:hypothetical protein [Gemmatimonadota bacterium]
MTAPSVAEVTDHRTVPLEVLREFARSEAERTSLRHAAEDAGVGRSTIHKFIMGGTTPHPRVRRLLALWYLRRMQGVDEVELIRPYAAALDVLLAQVPATTVQRVTLGVLASIRDGIAAEGEDPPRWLDVLRRRRVGWMLGHPSVKD